MEQVLLVVQVIVAIGLIGMVLIQRSDSDGFGLSGGSGNNLMSGRGAANAMTRITAIFAALFIINSLALGIIAAHNHAPSIAEKIEEQQSSEPAVPTVPLAGATKTDKKTDAKADVKTDAKAKAIEESAPEKELKVPTEGEVKKEASKKVVAKKKPIATEESSDEHNE